MFLAIAEVLPLLVGVVSTFLLSLLDFVFIDRVVHDAGHLVVDPLPLILVDLPSLEGVHLDEVKAAEELVVVDALATALEEVVLDWVVVLDGDETST